MGGLIRVRFRLIVKRSSMAGRLVAVRSKEGRWTAGSVQVHR